MTALSVVEAAESSMQRVGRLLAHGAVAGCAVVFLGGVALWARDDDLTAALWLLPETWSQAGVRAVGRGIGVSVGVISTYLMLLEVLAAAAGLTAAVLVMRGANTWFRYYVAVAIAVWATTGGTVPVLYRETFDGGAAEIPTLLQGLGWVAVFCLAYVFPDGRFVPPWSRWAAMAWAAYFLALGAAALLGYQSDPSGAVETIPLVFLFGTCLLAAVQRYRHVSSPEQRRQTRGVLAALALWFLVVLAALTPPLRGLLAQVSGPGLAANAVLLTCSYVVTVLLPTSVAVAVLRYRLYDVDVWVNSALVYGILSATVIGVYAVLAGFAGLLWDQSSLAAPLAATVVIAIVLHPLRMRVQRWVDRFVYGRRKEPYAVLSDLGRRLETVLPPDQVLRTLAEQVGTALKLHHVAAAHGDVVVNWPPDSVAPTTRVEVFALRWQDQQVGTLTVAARPGDDLSASDRDLLDGLARQAGAAVRAALLNDDLHRSRERIVLAREDERRRLQRDLHDGLGPTLASLYQRVDAARALYRVDPQAADRMLSEVAHATRSMIGEIRSIVRALRPPELDDLGLAGSLEAVGTRFEGIRVDVETVALPSLAPAVEAAVYRIAVEALTNAARHSDATGVTVRLALAQDALVLTVADNGCSLAADTPAGTGLRSMRERAEELGGSCQVGPAQGGGTLVRAVLPIGSRP